MYANLDSYLDQLSKSSNPLEAATMVAEQILDNERLAHDYYVNNLLGSIADEAIKMIRSPTMVLSMRDDQLRACVDRVSQLSYVTQDNEVEILWGDDTSVDDGTKPNEKREALYDLLSEALESSATELARGEFLAMSPEDRKELALRRHRFNIYVEETEDGSGISAINNQLLWSMGDPNGRPLFWD